MGNFDAFLLDVVWFLSGVIVSGIFFYWVIKFVPAMPPEVWLDRRGLKAVPKDLDQPAAGRPAEPAKVNMQEIRDDVKAELQSQYDKSLEVSRNILEREYLDKLAAIDVDQLRGLMGEISRLGQAAGLFTYKLSLDSPNVPKTAVDGRQRAIFLTSINTLSSYCSVRKLQEALVEYNERCRSSGQGNIAIPQHLIRSTLNEYTFSDDNQRPIFIKDDNGRSDLYLLAYEYDKQGSARRLVSLRDLVSGWQANN